MIGKYFERIIVNQNLLTFNRSRLSFIKYDLPDYCIGDPN